MQFAPMSRALLRALGIVALAAVALGASVDLASGASLRSALRLGDDSTARPVLPEGLERIAGGLVGAPFSSPLFGAGLTPDSIYGRSGKLRARIISPRRGSFAIPVLTRLFGDSAARTPGIYEVQDSAFGGSINFITLVPFENKMKGKVGDYRIGYWPEERGRLRSDAYENPDGFIEITPENQDLQISEHFRLRDFLTHDQQDVWPKYLVLSEALVDKLELVIQDLEAHGVRVERMRVMSGFRTPQYNQQGVGRRGGRAKDSRHQFGDAADVFVDNNGDGRMDDLNGDRRVDSKDARVIVAAVERVERAHPELAGGGGIYRATRAHGPFAHIDARGKRARWGRS